VAGARLNRRWHLTSYFCELLPAERLALCKRSDVRGGSKCEELSVSKSSPLRPAKRTAMRGVATSLMGQLRTIHQPCARSAALLTLIEFVIR
jgi:hypothetical protein